MLQLSSTRRDIFVTCDDYVTMSDGTGIVHIAPAFGEDDAKVGRKYDLPFVQFVDGKGELTRKHHMQDFSLRRQTQKYLKTLIKRASYLMLLSSSMIIHSAGDVIHHSSTMQENHGLLR